MLEDSGSADEMPSAGLGGGKNTEAVSGDAARDEQVQRVGGFAGAGLLLPLSCLLPHDGRG